MGSESESIQGSYNTNDHHVVIFPFLAQGHTLPLLDLSKAITSLGVKVTIITTPKNALQIQPHISNYPNISLAILPFDHATSSDEDNCIIHQGYENTSHLPSDDLFAPFVASIKKTLKKPFEEFLTNMSGKPPLCVISDFFVGWTVDVCASLGIPRIVFHGMGVLTMAILKAMHKNVIRVISISDGHPITEALPISHIPFSLYKSDFPVLRHINLEKHGEEDPVLQVLNEIEDTDSRSYGVLANSFEELEGAYVDFLETYYGTHKVWCVGPGLLWEQTLNKSSYDHVPNIPSNGQSRISLNSSSSDQFEIYLNSLSNGQSKISLNSLPIGQSEIPHYKEWLEAMKNVIYVSFGSQSHMSDAQMDELARGLEKAGHPFLWVVRSSTWGCSDKGWENRVNGLVVREWVDQRLILSHPSVRGFLSHCGWNSVLESLSYGVPILAWPMTNDQPVNAKVVAKGFEAGIVLCGDNDDQEGVGEIVGGDVISEGIKELMEGDKGEKVREKAIEIGKKAKEAVRMGTGSSYIELGQMIDKLVELSNNKSNV